MSASTFGDFGVFECAGGVAEFEQNVSMENAQTGIFAVCLVEAGEGGQRFGVLRLIDELDGFIHGFAILRRELLEGFGEGSKIELGFGRLGETKRCAEEENGECRQFGGARHLS